eukprot:6959269-Prymnesium_polylepis.1
MFERARLAPLPLAPDKAPCCAMPATCWPHGPAGLLSRAGAALKTAASRRQTSASRGRCAPTVACKCATDSNPRK